LRGLVSDFRHVIANLTSKCQEGDDATCSHYRIKGFRVREKRFEEERFTIGEMARCTGVSIETIRYYERIALMPRPPRTSGGHRAYGADSLRTLAFIKRARELGFRLEDIRALLALRETQGCCIDVKAIAGRHLDVVRTKIRDLVEMEKLLAATVARCPGDRSTDCPVLEILDIAAP
jgi:MerR family mercuric resistance operon transcriptional regulator